MEGFEELLVKQEPKNVSIEFKGKEYKFKIKDLSWAKRNRILSHCVIYQQKNVVVDMDAYYRTSLQEMIVEAPWPKEKTNEILKDINGDFGLALQQFVPQPFTDSEEGIPKN